MNLVFEPAQTNKEHDEQSPVSLKLIEFVTLSADQVSEPLNRWKNDGRD